MPLGGIGSTASGTYHVVVQPHVVVHSGDLLSAVIGGGVVLLGVMLAEILTRVRERRRLDEAAWDLQSALRGGLLTGRIVGKTTAEAAASYADVMHQLGRIRREAK